jgi:hypothetical protein
MKTFFLTLIFIGWTFTAAAQDPLSCTDAIEQGSNIILSAQDLLTAGDTEGASVLLADAQALLDSCTPAAEVLPAATDIASQPTPSASASTGYMVTAPPLIEADSIAFVRFAHTSVDIGPLDIYLGQDNVLMVSNLNFAEVTDFIPINGGELTFQVRQSQTEADSEILYTFRWNFVGNSSWIITAIGVAERLAFTVEPVSITRNDYTEEHARIRIVNLAAPAPRATVTTDTDMVLANNLGWIGIQDTQLRAGSYTLQLASTDGISVANELLQFDFAADVTYTLYIIGRGTAELPLQVINIVSPADVTQVQFVNNSATAVDIHYRPSNLLLVENLEAGAESDWLELPSGDYTFITYAVGTGPTGQELEAISVQLRPARFFVFDISATDFQITYESVRQEAE